MKLKVTKYCLYIFYNETLQIVINLGDDIPVIKAMIMFSSSQCCTYPHSAFSYSIECHYLKRGGKEVSRLISYGKLKRPDHDTHIEVFSNALSRFKKLHEDKTNE